MAKEAIELYLESCKAHSEPIPEESGVESLVVEIKGQSWKFKILLPKGGYYSWIDKSLEPFHHERRPRASLQEREPFYTR